LTKRQKGTVLFCQNGKRGRIYFIVWSPSRNIGVWASITAGSSFDFDKQKKGDAISDFAFYAFDQIASKYPNP
jgi:hypothetical protein